DVEGGRDADRAQDPAGAAGDGCRGVSSSHSPAPCRLQGELRNSAEVIVMRVFVAGGTGVVGRRLVPRLVERGHQVTATTSSPRKVPMLEQLGADAVVMNGLDATSVGEAVADARPDTIVHQ